MHEFTQILGDATRAIEAPYFLLPVHGGAPVKRERVYCYELYHQMRQLWPENAQHSLNGELDKRNHPMRE